MELSIEQINDALMLTSEQTAAAVKLGEALELARITLGQAVTPEGLTTMTIKAAFAIIEAWDECFALIYDADDDSMTMGDAFRVKCVAAGMVDVP